MLDPKDATEITPALVSSIEEAMAARRGAQGRPAGPADQLLPPCAR